MGKLPTNLTYLCTCGSEGEVELSLAGRQAICGTTQSTTCGIVDLGVLLLLPETGGTLNKVGCEAPTQDR